MQCLNQVYHHRDHQQFANEKECTSRFEPCASHHPVPFHQMSTYKRVRHEFTLVWLLGHSGLHNTSKERIMETMASVQCYKEPDIYSVMLQHAI
jgi:hypothetical protein